MLFYVLKNVPFFMTVKKPFHTRKSLIKDLLTKLFETRFFKNLSLRINQTNFVNLIFDLIL